MTIVSWCLEQGPVKCSAPPESSSHTLQGSENTRWKREDGKCPANAFRVRRNHYAHKLHIAVVTCTRLAQDWLGLFLHGRGKSLWHRLLPDRWLADNGKGRRSCFLQWQSQPCMGCPLITSHQAHIGNSDKTQWVTHKRYLSKRGTSWEKGSTVMSRENDYDALYTIIMLSLYYCQKINLF